MALGSELVPGAVVHAHTMIDLRLTLGRRHLLIAVRDGSTAMPCRDGGPPQVAATGRSLALVNAVA